MRKSGTRGPNAELIGGRSLTRRGRPVIGSAACPGRANRIIRPWSHMVIPMCGRVSLRGSDGAIEPLHHAADLPRFPYPAAGRGWDAALVECHCDAVPRLYPATPQFRDDGSELRCPRVGTRNKGFAPGLAGLGLPSDFHGFQGKGKTRAKGVEPRGNLATCGRAIRL
jgi:hypothetical protein